MEKKLRFRIYCNTDSQYEYVWGKHYPTECPVDSGHSVDLDKVKIVRKRIGKTISISDSPYKAKRAFTMVDTSGGAITINLAKATHNNDRDVIIQRTVGSNTITIQTTGGDLIDGYSSITIPTNDFTPQRYYSNGSAWSTVSIGFDDFVEDEEERKEQIDNEDKRGIIMASDGVDFKDIAPGQTGQVLMVDLTKLQGVKWGVINTSHIRNFSYATTSYVSNKNIVGCAIVECRKKKKTTTNITAFIFDGTNNSDSIGQVKVILYNAYDLEKDNSDTTSTVRIVDVKRNVICSMSHTGAVEELSNGGVLLSTTNIQNLPTTATNLLIQLELDRGNSGSTDAFLGLAQILILP